MTSESKGLTPSEQYLLKLCRASFLSLWSYANPYNNRGATDRNPQGKELCDLLVVFGDDIIIFSDKSCEMPSSGNDQLDWNRWYKRAIERSAEQTFGAERWIRRYHDRVYLDRKCQIPFPISLMCNENTRFHRIVVALGAGRRAETYFGGGSSGSLMLIPSLTGAQHYSTEGASGPFRIGQVDSDKGFVHVFDDVTLDIVLRELDTIYDFVSYLRAKENLLTSPKIAICHGEEELLSFYLRNKMRDADDGFDLNWVPNIDEFSLVLAEGLWDEFVASREYEAQRELKKAGKFIDKLIENVSTHITTGTLAYGSEYSFTTHEENIRFLAAEPRITRAVFAHAMLQKIASTPVNMRSSIVLESAHADRRFVFLLISRNHDQSQRAYRIARQALLEAYAHVVKAQNPNIRYVYGLATEAGRHRRGRSEDFMSFDFVKWTEEDQSRANILQKELKILDEYSPRTIFEPPNVSRYEPDAGNRKERRLNRSLSRRR